MFGNQDVVARASSPLCSLNTVNSEWESSMGEPTIETNRRELAESGRFVLVKESFLRTDSVASDPSITWSQPSLY